MHPNLLLCRSQSPLGTLSLPPHLSSTFFLLLSSLFILIRTQPHSSPLRSSLPPPSLPLAFFLSPPFHTSIKQETAQGPALIYFLPVSVFVIWLWSDAR